jgi:hypothetical protein
MVASDSYSIEYELEEYLDGFVEEGDYFLVVLFYVDVFYIIILEYL